MIKGQKGMDLTDLKYNSDGLIPAIVQDIQTGGVLMLAYMNKEALEKTIDTGFAHYWSRSRKRLWMKGESSGNTQKVCDIYHDCDKDTLLLKVEQKGGACHKGSKSCFGDCDNRINAIMLYELYNIIKGRKKLPVEGSYTNYLLDEGLDKILKKIGEEATEVIIGAKNNCEDEIVYEISDLIYHIMVLLVDRDIELDKIFEELNRRR